MRPEKTHHTAETRTTYLYFHRAEKGGQFAAGERPEIFAAELRAAFGPLR
jgi:hypothetical protein